MHLSSRLASKWRPWSRAMQSSLHPEMQLEKYHFTSILTVGQFKSIDYQQL